VTVVGRVETATLDSQRPRTDPGAGSLSPATSGQPDLAAVKELPPSAWYALRVSRLLDLPRFDRADEAHNADKTQIL